jgi:hypothetical protein
MHAVLSHCGIIMRFFFTILAGLLIALIAWAYGQASLAESFKIIIRDPWGVVMLVDLYIGFIVAAVLFSLVERPWVALLLMLASFVLGNIVAALWLAARGLPFLHQAKAGKTHP